MVDVPKIVAANTYRGRHRVTNAVSSISIAQFFNSEPSSANGEFNDLGAAGILPDNASGTIVGLQCSIRPPTLAAVSVTNVITSKAARDCMRFRNDVLVEIIVNGIVCARGPFACFPHSPAWVSGSQGGTLGDTSSIFLAENGGWSPTFVPLEVGPRQTIQVRYTGTLVTAIESATGDLFLDTWLQVITKRPI